MALQIICGLATTQFYPCSTPTALSACGYIWAQDGLNLAHSPGTSSLTPILDDGKIAEEFGCVKADVGIERVL